MRRPLLGFAAAVAIAALAPSGRTYAQTVGTGYDVFQFYYGYYLPHQAAIAAQPTPLDTINQNMAQRQLAAATDRTALYDPISPYGDEDIEPGARFSRRGGERGVRTGGGGGGFGGSTKGEGPALYYNRTARYFPGMRQGRGSNSNLARVRTGRGGGMGMGMGMPSMPGMGPR
jgi:hypothetical protein